jgi:hypothetical protein
MGKFLDQLFEDVKDSDFDTKMKKICDRIMDEEIKDIIDNEEIKKMLKRSTVFIVLPCKEPDTFLCLEREVAEEYIISLWNKDISGKKLRRFQSWTTKEISGSHQKIIKMYGEKLKELIKK